jgi:hypothetical protein
MNNRCISTGDTLLFLQNASSCSTDDSTFSARADISDASICIDASTDGSFCKRASPNDIQFQFYVAGSDGSPSGDGTGESCAGQGQGTVQTQAGTCHSVDSAVGFAGIQLESGPSGCRLELFSDSACTNELPIQSNANAKSCIANPDVPAAQGLIYSC